MTLVHSKSNMSTFKECFLSETQQQKFSLHPTLSYEWIIPWICHLVTIPVVGMKAKDTSTPSRQAHIKHLTPSSTLAIVWYVVDIVAIGWGGRRGNVCNHNQIVMWLLNERGLVGNSIMASSNWSLTSTQAIETHWDGTCEYLCCTCAPATTMSLAPPRPERPAVGVKG